MAGQARRYKSQNTMTILQNPSIKFFTPYAILSIIIFFIIYFSGISKYLGAADGYGWSNSILLDRVFGFLNVKVPKEFYMVCFVIFYFIISVPLQEYVFRVLPLRFFHSKLKYVIITSLIFMLCHLYYMQLPGLILTGGMGVLLSIDYYNNRNFWVLLFVHALFASMAFTLGLA
jgi:Type II CAAX prenyl endopeptidase Rce1-like